MADKELTTCDLSGNYQVTTEDGKSYNMRLPGTLADNGIGHRDSLSNVLDLNCSGDPEDDPLNHILDEAGLLSEERKHIRLTWEEEKIETRYTRLYAYEGVARISRFIHFQSDEKELYLLVERARELKVFLDDKEIPEVFEGTLPTPRVFNVSGKMNGEHTLTFASNNAYPEFPRSFILRSNMASNDTQTNWNGLLGKIRLLNRLPEFQKAEKNRITIDSGNHFLRDGQPFYIYGETNFAVYPETSGFPMDEKTWELIFKTYSDYGINFIRFETCCPPEAAFAVADRMDISLMPELSMNGLRTPINERTRKYYQNELRSILLWYGHHPSFSFLSVGSSNAKNSTVKEFFESLISEGKELDSTKLYTAFFNSCLKNADFYIARSATEAVAKKGKPLILESRLKTEILTDFSEIDLFTGSLLPYNLMQRQKRVEEAGLTRVWNEYLEVSGETSLRNIREEIQKIQWQENAAGILFRSLQDYPGRNEYPHGFLTSHLQTKNFDFANAKQFKEKLQVDFPVADFGRTVFEYGETLDGRIKIFEKREKPDSFVDYCLSGEGVSLKGRLDYGEDMKLSIPLTKEILHPEEEERAGLKLKLTLTYKKRDNTYKFFVYPSRIPFCPDLIYETEVLSDQVLEYLEQGGMVFFTPPSRNKTGDQVLYIEKNHPVFENFKSDLGTDIPWKIFAKKEGFLLPANYRSLITVINHQLPKERRSLCFETRVGNGSIFVSGLSLKERMNTIEGRALLTAIYQYLSSFDFSPSQEMTFEELKEITEQEIHLGNGNG